MTRYVRVIRKMRWKKQISGLRPCDRGKKIKTNKTTPCITYLVAEKVRDALDHYAIERYAHQSIKNAHQPARLCGRSNVTITCREVKAHTLGLPRKSKIVMHAQTHNALVTSLVTE